MKKAEKYGIGGSGIITPYKNLSINIDKVVNYIFTANNATECVGFIHNNNATDTFFNKE